MEALGKLFQRIKLRDSSSFLCTSGGEDNSSPAIADYKRTMINSVAIVSNTTESKFRSNSNIAIKQNLTIVRQQREGFAQVTITRFFDLRMKGLQ